jgi:hypothetical protein
LWERTVAESDIHQWSASGGVSVRPTTAFTPVRVRFDLEIHAFEAEGELSVFWVYKTRSCTVSGEYSKWLGTICVYWKSLLRMLIEW